jgi:ankyrin repeat protein
LAASNGHIDCVRMLITREAIKELKNNYGRTALDVAQKLEQHDVVRFINYVLMQNAMIFLSWIRKNALDSWAAHAVIASRQIPKCSSAAAASRRVIARRIAR